MFELTGWDAFAQNIEFDVGVGNRVQLWHDRWSGESPLREVFLVYSLVILTITLLLICVWLTRVMECFRIGKLLSLVILMIGMLSWLWLFLISVTLISQVEKGNMTGKWRR